MHLLTALNSLRTSNVTDYAAQALLVSSQLYTKALQQLMPPNMEVQINLWIDAQVQLT